MKLTPAQWKLLQDVVSRETRSVIDTYKPAINLSNARLINAEKYDGRLYLTPTEAGKLLVKEVMG